MKKLRVLDLFSGIGGFSLGLERTGGFETTAFCEIDPFCRRVLAKHWPDVSCYPDVTTLRGEDVGPIDVICGGFPCQDLSLLGKQAGIVNGSRSGLWSEIARLAGELRPRYVIVENVTNLLAGPAGQPGGWFGRVLGDLAELGYDAEWEVIPAATVGAPHLRERVWLIAYRDEGAIGTGRVTGLQDGKGYDWPRLVFASGSRSDHGVPNWVDRVGSLGNAVVPQIPELISHAILASIG